MNPRTFKRDVGKSQGFSKPVGLQYQNYSDGILYESNITGTETGMILLPRNIVLQKCTLFSGETISPVSCKAEGKMAYVKVHF